MAKKTKQKNKTQTYFSRKNTHTDFTRTQTEVHASYPIISLLYHPHQHWYGDSWRPQINHSDHEDDNGRCCRDSNSISSGLSTWMSLRVKHACWRTLKTHQLKY